MESQVIVVVLQLPVANNSSLFYFLIIINLLQLSNFIIKPRRVFVLLLLVLSLVLQVIVLLRIKLFSIVSLEDRHDYDNLTLK